MGFFLLLNYFAVKAPLFSLIFCFCCIASHSIAQTDTVYFDQDWDTCAKNVAHYSRVVQKEMKGLAVVDYYPNGKIKMTGTYDVDSPKNKQGYFKSFDEDGLLKSEGNYINNKTEGLHKRYNAEGSLWLEEEISNGQNNGTLKTYFTSGAIKRIEQYKNGKFIDGKCFATSGLDTAFYPYQEMPEFIGGVEALYTFLEKKVHYPKPARKAKIEGTVHVLFVVDVEGNVTDIKVKKRGNQYLDEEAIRVLSLSPKWKPGTIEGRAVNVFFTIPIKFLLH